MKVPCNRDVGCRVPVVSGLTPGTIAKVKSCTMLLKLVYSDSESLVRAPQDRRISLQGCEPFRRLDEAFTHSRRVCILAATELAHGSITRLSLYRAHSIVPSPLGPG